MDYATFNDRYNKAPNIFKDWMQGKLDLSDATILDFGCDTGVMTLGIANHCNPKKVIGIDINSNHKYLINETYKHLNINKLPDNLGFYITEPNEKLAEYFSKRSQSKFDCIFSWSVFEHVSQEILEQMIIELHKTVRKDGYAFIQIAPLYYSAFGSHLSTLIPEPWAHLTTQLNLFQSYIFDSPKTSPYEKEDNENFEKIKHALWSTYITLNKITADKLIDLFISTGFILIDQYRSFCQINPTAELTSIYKKEILVTEQIVGLFKKV